MTTPFWYNEPTILFNKEHVFQLWPTKQMTMEAKLNAISRLVILMTIFGFLFTQNWKIFIIGFITLAIVFSLYNLRKKTIIKEGFKVKEGYQSRISRISSISNLDPISLTIILGSIVVYLLTGNYTLFIIGTVIVFIYLVYKSNNESTVKEGFEQIDEPINMNMNMTTNPITLESVLRTSFHPTTKKNPFGNVLLTDIVDTPDRLAAAPSFNPDVHDEITRVVKKQTQMLNPNIINTNKQIYGDLYEKYNLDKSMMRFYSTANTRVENDQGAYSQFLYGGMYSAKEDTPEGAMMRVKDNYQYINP